MWERYSSVKPWPFQGYLYVKTQTKICAVRKSSCGLAAEAIVSAWTWPKLNVCCVYVDPMLITLVVQTSLQFVGRVHWAQAQQPTSPDFLVLNTAIAEGWRDEPSPAVGELLCFQKDAARQILWSAESLACSSCMMFGFSQLAKIHSGRSQLSTCQSPSSLSGFIVELLWLPETYHYQVSWWNTGWEKPDLQLMSSASDVQLFHQKCRQPRWLTLNRVLNPQFFCLHVDLYTVYYCVLFMFCCWSPLQILWIQGSVGAGPCFVQDLDIRISAPSCFRPKNTSGSAEFDAPTKLRTTCGSERRRPSCMLFDVEVWWFTWQTWVGRSSQKARPLQEPCQYQLNDSQSEVLVSDRVFILYQIFWKLPVLLIDWEEVGSFRSFQEVESATEFSWQIFEAVRSALSS